MDTPLSKSSSFSFSNKLINTPSSNSPAFQDSPVFNYISNLSPIQPVKAEPGAQGFPGLASPPLLFTSPRINSLQSLLNRKLQSSGSLESPHEKNKCHKNDEDPGNLSKASPECIRLSDSDVQRACSVKNLGQVAHCSPGCIDDFLSDPDANSSCKPQSDDTSLPSRGVSLQKGDNSRGENADLYRSAPIQVRKGAHAKSRISIKVVKNEARHLMPSSECLGSLPRLLTEPAFEACQNGESLNEASQFERGTLRRCLFEENQKNSSDDSDFRNFSDNLTRIEELTNLSSTGTPGNREMMKRPNTATGACALPPTESSHVPISKPLGIGLHLNSVVYPRSLDSLSGSQQPSLAGLDRKNSVVTGNQLDRETNATIVGKVSTTSEEKHNNKASSIATSGEAMPLNIEHFSSPVLLKQDARTIITCPKRKISPPTAESDELHCKMSPKKKRKKSSDDDTSKRCNCKKTKCLKLYCDCFAAGLYCTESCACQGCCNHLENEDTVLETRQQIETRNPLAFAPKVVQLVTDSPAATKEVQNLSTPSSARHKIGCNCKKSMCLKKYCECYQANVGCSDGCRCEGCKNVFGVRKDYSVIRGLVVRNAANEVSEAILDRRQENTIVGSNFDNSRVHNSPNLTPPTPALPCSDARKNAPKSKLSLRDLQTPEFQNEDVSSDENFLTCPENSQTHGMLLEKPTESIDEDAFHSEKVLESAGDESFSTSSLISNSVATLMIPPSSSKKNNIVMSSSLRWRSSPITPITQSAGLKFQDFGSGSKHFDMTEDDTPNVLKESSTPAKSVKVSSPNKKRISAPRNPVDSLGSLGDDSPNPNPTNSAGSLKICHRFVLQSLPTFPSLTPFSKKQQ